MSVTKEKEVFFLGKRKLHNNNFKLYCVTYNKGKLTALRYELK